MSLRKSQDWAQQKTHRYKSVEVEVPGDLWEKQIVEIKQ